jgi:saccharopine dehydrogenase-like NADP-dependent oxidoreductase
MFIAGENSMKIIVLGAGLVGGPMSLDLAEDPQFAVWAADIHEDPLVRLSQKGRISTIRDDLSDAEKIKKIVSDFDMVINALPGSIGFQVLKSVIEAGKNVVDIAFFPEDPFKLDEMAKANGVTAVEDCGVSPGMSNILIGHADCLLDKTDRIRIYVGGLPVKREGPLEYKVLFSLADLFEVYMRPVRIMKKGKIVTLPPLSDLESIKVSGVGTLEAFSTDGLRTLVQTIECPDMKESTLRYPGHVDKIKLLNDCGLLDKKEIRMNGDHRVRPIDVTVNVLSSVLRFEPGEKDITIMQLVVEGRRKGKKKKYIYELHDEYDVATRVHSMARTTGYTANSVARMIAAGLYVHEGISPPEFIGRKKECVDFLKKELRDRSVTYKESIDEQSG